MFPVEICYELGPKAEVIRVTHACNLCDNTNGAMKKINENWVYLTYVLGSKWDALSEYAGMYIEKITEDATDICDVWGHSGESVYCGKRDNNHAHIR
jgi:hypothetical protein